MSQQHILYVCAQSVSLYLGVHGRLFHVGCFDHSNQGVQAFGRYLQKAAQTPYVLLVNLASEDFQREVIPVLRARNRCAMIARRLAQHFPGTTYTYAASLRIEKAERKNELLLLSALTDTHNLDPWLTVLEQHAVSLRGVYTLSSLMAVLLKKLKFPDADCLLLTHQDSSLRESFLVRSQLQFSRLCPLPMEGCDEPALLFSKACAQEAKALRHYLLGQRLIKSEAMLRVIIIAHPQWISTLRTYCTDDHSLGFHFLSSQECARRVGLKALPMAYGQEGLYVALLMRLRSYRGLAQLAPPGLRRRYQQRVWQHWGLFLSAVGLLISFIVAVNQLNAARELSDAAQALNEQMQHVEKIYHGRRASYASSDVSYDTLRWIKEEYALFAPPALSLERVYLQLSRALDQHPQVLINSIEWQSRSHLPMAVGERYVARVSGYLSAAARDTPRQLVSQFDAFVGVLRSDFASVSILQAPIELGRSQTPSKVDGDRPELQHKPFVLTLSDQVSP